MKLIYQFIQLYELLISEIINEYMNFTNYIYVYMIKEMWRKRQDVRRGVCGGHTVTAGESPLLPGGGLTLG